MANQAESLRQLSSPQAIKVIAISSGKGGVGKTNVAVNLAVGLASMRRSVVLFDADLGLANVDIALGLKPRYDIRHVLSGERSLEEVLIEGPGGIRIVPAASGVAKMAQLTPQEQGGLVRAFSELSFPVDTLLVDTGAGIDNNVLTFASSCQEIIVVICDEPTSLTDAYALIKVLNRQCAVKRFQILANMIDDDRHGARLYDKLARVTDQFLDVQLGYLGAVPRDPYLQQAVRQQTAVIQAFPRSPSAVALRTLAQTVDTRFKPQDIGGGLGFFVERLLDYGRTRDARG